MFPGEDAFGLVTGVLLVAALSLGWAIQACFKGFEETGSDMGRGKGRRKNGPHGASQAKVLNLKGKRAKREEKKEDIVEAETKYTSPRVVIDRMVHHKIMHWVKKATGEISGLGKVQRLADGSFRVIDAMLLPQENTGASTELDGPAVAKAMYALRETPGDLNYWWHSHVNMEAFWSGTDLDTMKQFASSSKDGGYCVATVFNKKYQSKSALCLNAKVGEAPFALLVDDLPTEITTFLREDAIKAWDEEYEKNCRTKTWGHQDGYGGWHGDEHLEEDGWTWVNNHWEKVTEHGGKVSDYTGRPPEDRYSNLRTPWSDPPEDWEIANGYMIRWNALYAKNRKYLLLPDGRFQLNTIEVHEEVKLSDYSEWHAHANQPRGIPKEINPKHPLERKAVSDGRPKVDVAALREKVKGKSITEILEMEESGLISDEEALMIWRWPEMEKAANQDNWDDVIKA